MVEGFVYTVCCVTLVRGMSRVSLDASFMRVSFHKLGGRPWKVMLALFLFLRGFWGFRFEVFCVLERGLVFGGFGGFRLLSDGFRGLRVFLLVCFLLVLGF